MKKMILCAAIFSMSIFQVSAGKDYFDLSKEDIEKSTQRIRHSFSSQHHQRSILENEIPVGETSNSGTEFYVTYRPSLGMEILNCIDRSPLPLNSKGIPLPGDGHKGLTQFFSKESVENTVITPFKQYIDESRPSLEQVTIFIDGMSAGAHRAVETAAYLKQHDDTKNIQSIILRYGDSKTFADVTVDAIHDLLGEYNILSFHAEGDKIAEYLDMSNVSRSLGQRITFSAQNSISYTTRVNNAVYTGMDPNLRNIIKSPLGLLLGALPPQLSSFVTPAVWELHQPITYAELCPDAFEKFQQFLSAD